MRKIVPSAEPTCSCRTWPWSYLFWGLGASLRLHTSVTNALYSRFSAQGSSWTLPLLRCAIPRFFELILRIYSRERLQPVLRESLWQVCALYAVCCLPRRCPLDIRECDAMQV